MEHIYDLIIVGGGPAGYTAALYGARAGLDTLVLEKLSAGGQMALTHQIDNYPGFGEGIDGFTLGQKMEEGALRFGAKNEYAEVYSMELHENPKKILTSEGTFYARTVAIATGANPRPLGLPNEQNLVGQGLHYCAACDGMFYKGKTVAVIGGGNSAAADAMTLSRIAKKVILIHRRDSLRATQVYHKPLTQADNIEFRWNSTVESMEVRDRIAHLTLKDTQTSALSSLEVDGVFVSIGRQPASELVQGQLELDKAGYIAAGEDTRTSIPGVYAIGDVRTKQVRQVVTAVADGAVAVHQAEDYLTALL